MQEKDRLQRMKTGMISILLWAAADCFGQIDLRGTVKDASTGRVVSGAILHIEGTELRDTSDLNGEFRIAKAPTSLIPNPPHFRPAGSRGTRVRIFQLSQARQVAEYAVPPSVDWRGWPRPGLPAGLYLLEAKTAASITKQAFISLGGTSAAAGTSTRLQAPENPFLGKTGSTQAALSGNKPGYFPRRQALETLVQDGMTVWLRRSGSFDGLWIGRTEFQDTMMMAIEGDSLTYLRGPDSLVNPACTLRRIFEVPSTFLAAPTSGHISNDSMAGGVPFEFPGARYKFDVTAGFATDSTAEGRMEIDVDLPSSIRNGPACAGSGRMAWSAAKIPFDTRFDGSWKGVDSKGDSVRFKVQKGRLNEYSVEFRFDFSSCAQTPSGGGTTGFPYWVLPEGRFSFFRMDKEPASISTYRLEGRFTSATSAAGTAHFAFSNSSPEDPTCDLSDSVTWTAERMP